MKKILALIFSFLFAINVYGADLDIVSQSAVVMDCKTGRVLWQKNMDKEMPMASTTKIMTAVIALESGKTEETVVAGKNAATAPKVKMGLSTGEKHRLYDLLYPLMLQSSNDAAVAIAEHIGGNIEGFAVLMNEKAKKLGANNTEFVTPNGLDKGNHHSTAYDMALISRYALENEDFLKIINTKSITIPLKNNDEKQYSIYNKNRLLSEYDGAIGVKTGFTNKAGNCFVGAAQRGEKRFVSVVLASGWGSRGKEAKWSDTKKLLNYAFDNYNYYEVLKKGENTGNVAIIKGDVQSVPTEIEEGFTACLTEEENKNIKISVNIPKEIQAPVLKGKKAGKITAYLENGEIIAKSNLVFGQNAARHDFKTSMEKVLKLWFNIDVDYLNGLYDYFGGRKWK